MFKLLGKCQRIGRTRFNTKCTECTHPQAVDMPVDSPFLLSILSYNRLGNNFYCPVRTVYFTDPAASALMLVVFIMRHYHFTLESVKHHKVFPVVWIFLRDYLTGTEEISAGYSHSFKQRPETLYYFFKILNYTTHI